MHATFKYIEQLYQNVLVTRFRPRLWMPLALAIFAIMLALQAAFILSASRANEKELLRRLESDALRLVKASFDVWSFPSAEDILRILDQNMLISDLKGGWLFRSQDKQGNVFGEPPVLTPTQVLKESASRRFDPAKHRLDLFVSHEKTALQYDMILRLDTNRIFESSTVDISWELIQALLIALIGSLLMIPAIQNVIVRPLEKITENVTAAAANPGEADSHMTRPGSQNEIGQIGQSIDSLFKTMAVIYRQQNESVNEYFEDCPLAVLEFGHDGSLLSANDAAREVFRGVSQAELSELASLSCLFDGETGAVTLFDSLAAGSYVRKALFSTAGVETRAIIAARSANTNPGHANRHVVTIVDLDSGPVVAGENAATLSHDADSGRQLNRRVFELKQFLESCMSIISDGVSGETPESLNLKPIILDWHQVASRGGSTHHEPPIFQILPDVMGTPGGVESILRHALTFVCLNSLIDAPQIDVQASMTDDGSVRIFVRDFRANLDIPSHADDTAVNTDSQLFILALKKLLKAENGSWIEVDRKKNANCVAFQLPAAIAATESDRQTA